MCDTYTWKFLLDDNQEQKPPLYFSEFHCIPQQNNQ